MKKQLRKYIKIRQKTKNYNPESVRSAFESGVASLLKNRDPQGRIIGLGIPGHWDEEKVSSDQIIVLGCLTLEQAAQSIETQQKGMVFVVDAIGLTFSQCMKFGFRQISKAVAILKGGFPIQLKEVHIVNEPKAFGILYSIFNPLLSEKMRKRLFIHGKDLDALYNHLPREILPESIGGDLPNNLATDRDFIPGLLLRDEYFKTTSELICRS